MKEYCIITFESVNFAMQAESVLKNHNIYHQVIPTPREITLSCGLSIRFNVDNVEKIKTFVDNKKINIKNMYIVRGSGSDKIIEALK